MIKKKQTALFSLKIIYFYLILTIAIITIGLAGFCFYYYKNSLSNTKNIIHQLTSSAARQIDLQISSMDNLAQQLVSNKALIQTMGNLSNTEKRRPGNSFTENYVMANQLSTLLQQTCLPGPLMERISVANDQGDYLAICSNYKFLDSNQKYNSYLYSDDFLSLYKTIKQKEIIKFTAFSQYDKWLPENNIPIISCYRPITDIYTFQIHGILEIQRPFTIIENILKNINYSHIQVYLFDDSNQMIYQNLNAQKAAPLTSDTIFDQNGVNTQFQQQYPFSDYSTIEGANWKLISILPISSVAQPIINVIAIVAFILASLIIFVLITVATVEKNIRIPLGNLKNSLSVIDINNLDINFDSKSAELEQIRHVFLEIIRRLKDSIEKNEYLHRQDLKSQMFALQAQINPHFVHNILTVISALGQEAGAPRIMKICRKFSDMLSYSAEYSNDFTTLSQEFIHTENYLFLMKERYGGNLEYKIIRPVNNALSHVCPKLFLQPLVENCISHAFEYTLTPWKILILYKETAETWQVEIHDNGCGFSEQSKEEIFRLYADYQATPSLNILNTKIGGLGIISTVVRLYLLYDTRIIFDIGHSKLGGSKITLGGYINDD